MNRLHSTTILTAAILATFSSSSILAISTPVNKAPSTLPASTPTSAVDEPFDLMMMTAIEGLSSMSAKPGDDQSRLESVEYDPDLNQLRYFISVKLLAAALPAEDRASLCSPQGPFYAMTQSAATMGEVVTFKISYRTLDKQTIVREFNCLPNHS